MCGGCQGRLTGYCSVKCQVLHWPNHQIICGSLSLEEQEAKEKLQDEQMEQKDQEQGQEEQPQKEREQEEQIEHKEIQYRKVQVKFKELKKEQELKEQVEYKELQDEQKQVEYKELKNGQEQKELQVELGELRKEQEQVELKEPHNEKINSQLGSNVIRSSAEFSDLERNEKIQDVVQRSCEEVVEEKHYSGRYLEDKFRFSLEKDLAGHRKNVKDTCIITTITTTSTTTSTTFFTGPSPSIPIAVSQAEEGGITKTPITEQDEINKEKCVEFSSLPSWSLPCGLCWEVRRKMVRVVCDKSPVCWRYAVREISNSHQCWKCKSAPISTTDHLVKDVQLQAQAMEFLKREYCGENYKS